MLPRHVDVLNCQNMIVIGQHHVFGINFSCDVRNKELLIHQHNPRRLIQRLIVPNLHQINVEV